MELTPAPPGNDGKKAKDKGKDKGKDDGKGGLVWDPAKAGVNARLGPYTPAIVDYLLHPPPGNPVPGLSHPAGLANDRRAALEALVDAAFQP